MAVKNVTELDFEAIKTNLKTHLKNQTEFADYDFDGDFIEAQAFAYLSIRALLNLPSSFPNTTRCNFATVCGIINKNF